MRAIIYGYNTETKEWIELFNRGKFWNIMTDTYYKVWKTIRVSKKHKMKTYLLFKEGNKVTAMFPISYKTTCSALFLTSMCDFEYASEWRVRKTILELEEIGLIGKKNKNIEQGEHSSCFRLFLIFLQWIHLLSIEMQWTIVTSKQFWTLLYMQFPNYKINKFFMKCN